MSPKETNFLLLNARAVTGFLLSSLVASLILVLASAPAHAQIPNFVPNPLHNPICSKIDKQIEVSLGLRMYCFGPQPNGPGTGTSPSGTSSSGTTSYSGGGTSGFSRNVNAASLAEDISPNSTRAYGQSETSIAAWGPYVLEAWNDATAFFSPCPSPMNKEEGTGAGFSKDGGNTFIDIGGLPSGDCSSNLLAGDPSVEVFHAPNGTTYFYVSSLYVPLSFTDPTSKLALNVCTVSGGGNLSCAPAIVAAKSSECIDLFFCSFLDKEFLTLDPVNARLYVSYTEFGLTFTSRIDLAACDLTNPGAPVCENGSAGPSAVIAPPYYTLSTDDPNGCEQEGAYPAVRRMTGDLYVAWEYNWATNFFSSSCYSTPVHQVLARVPSACLGSGPPSATTTCPSQTTRDIPIVSMDTAFIAGYNRFPMNDFPRIAVSDWAGTVSVVWNDARSNPGGDILLRSFSLGSSLTPMGSAPVKVNNDNVLGTFHFLPALRNTDSNGRISVSWYDRRRNPNTALTDVFAAVSFDPRTSSSPSNQRVTDVASDWLAVSSDIEPNFGDYTDNYAAPPQAQPGENDPLFVAWSDGRLNDPQPFESHSTLTTSH